MNIPIKIEQYQEPNSFSTKYIGQTRFTESVSVNMSDHSYGIQQAEHQLKQKIHQQILETLFPKKEARLVAIQANSFVNTVESILKTKDEIKTGGLTYNDLLHKRCAYYRAIATAAVNLIGKTLD